MIYVISKATFGSYNVRDIQCNANWDCCPYSDYALIPDSMVEGILATKGYCDIVLTDDGNEVASFTARTIPSVEEECCGTNTVLSVNGKTANTAGEVSITASDVGALPLSGGTMTGQITLSSTGFKTSSNGGYSLDAEGNFIHQTTNTSNYFNIFSNDKTKKFSVYFETGNVQSSGTMTASGGFIGNASTATSLKSAPSVASASNSYHYAHFAKIDKLVICTLMPKALASTTQYTLTLTIPSGYRPGAAKTFTYFSDTAKWAGDDTGKATISVATNGTMTIAAAYGFSVGEASMTLCWATA